ncbi:MAG TPA: hypothetical protein VHE53_05555 [Patescibacteria group bacterium]|nr:hypothetical protein [Patescibacteria group bacterium]
MMERESEILDHEENLYVRAASFIDRAAARGAFYSAGEIVSRNPGAYIHLKHKPARSFVIVLGREDYWRFDEGILNILKENGGDLEDITGDEIDQMRRQIIFDNVKNDFENASQNLS